MSDETKIPCVFISYSHDSREHKEWVAHLAHELRQNGIEVLFDQWDLGPGDDVPKFMERSVALSDRVLMICTETYVRKADDGKGGVGYEAMVVTGELVSDLGKNKFVPVVRQKNPPKVLPRCVSTRFYVDLSDDTTWEEGFETLLRELHQSPKVVKPPLGTNPFLKGEFEGEKKKEAKSRRRVEFSNSLTSAASVYEKALEIIAADDRVQWRKFQLAAAETSSAALRSWRTEPVPELKDKNWELRYAHALKGIESFGPLIAALLAAAETGKEGYADQLGWVEPILNPHGYEVSGPRFYANFPQAVFFVSQALIGGMLMLSGAGEAAFHLASTKVADRYDSRESRPLFSMTKYNGWPESFDHTCTIAWKFLDYVISSWGFLTMPFGNEKECRAGVSAYYQLLTLLNGVSLFATGALHEKDAEGIPKRSKLECPVSFCTWPKEIVEQGYKLFLQQSRLIRRVFEANGIKEPGMQSFSEAWLNEVGLWLGQVHAWTTFDFHVPQRNLVRDLSLDPFQLK